MSAADLAEAVGHVADDARARRLVWLEALGHEDRLDMEQVGQAAPALAPEVAPEVSWREAVADALKNIGAGEHLANRGLVHGLPRLDFLNRVGLEDHREEALLVRAGDGALKVDEDAVAILDDSAEDVAAHCPAALVKLALAQCDPALGNALLEGDDVVREHLCFFGKELWLGLILPANTIVISIFSTKNKNTYFCFVFCLREAPLVPAIVTVPSTDAHPIKLAHIAASTALVLCCCAILRAARAIAVVALAGLMAPVIHALAATDVRRHHYAARGPDQKPPAEAAHLVVSGLLAELTEEPGTRGFVSRVGQVATLRPAPSEDAPLAARLLVVVVFDALEQGAAGNGDRRARQAAAGIKAADAAEPDGALPHLAVVRAREELQRPVRRDVEDGALDPHLCSSDAVARQHSPVEGTGGIAEEEARLHELERAVVRKSGHLCFFGKELLAWGLILPAKASVISIFSSSVVAHKVHLNIHAIILFHPLRL